MAVVPQCKSFLDIFEQAANSGTKVTVLDSVDKVPISYESIWLGARRCAASLQAKGVVGGAVVSVMMPTSIEFIQTYIAIVMCGALPFVVSGVKNSSSREKSIIRLLYLMNETGANLIVADEEELPFLVSRVCNDAKITSISWRELHTNGVHEPKIIIRSVSDPVLGQSSSGSTGFPTCVGLTTENVLINLNQIRIGLGARGDDKFVSWLPWYHDMGLVGCFLFPTYSRISSYVMNPMSFIRRPERWLYEMTLHGGTIAPAPNFAFDRLVARYQKIDRSRVNLKSWRAALCGAEPINANTMDRFVSLYGTLGLNETALTPCYGMAEATLAISFKPDKTKWKSQRVEKKRFVENRVVVVNCGDEKYCSDKSLELVSSGRPLDGVLMKIINDENSELPDAQVGRIMLSGPSISRWTFVDGTLAYRSDNWLDTGDIGYFSNGEVFITGRSKDVVIINGKNYAAHYFEHSAEELSPVLTGKTLAFGSSVHTGTEGLVLLVESSRDKSITEDRVRSHVARVTGILPLLKIVERNSLPRTTSGKLKRSEAKESYERFVANSGG